MSEPPRLPPADYESSPLTRAEYVTAIVHLYRGEMYRSTQWRVRLDTTTNWAILTTAGILSYAFGTEEHSHATLLFGLGLLSIFWVFEARRYRFADIWYSRVRKIEENFYGPILRRDPVSPEREWGQLVADDLFRPAFKIGRLHALRVRFLRNYWAMFLVLVVAWCVKVAIHPEPAADWSTVRARLETSMFAWWVPFLALAAFAAVCLGIVVFAPKPERDESRRFHISP